MKGNIWRLISSDVEFCMNLKRKINIFTTISVDTEPGNKQAAKEKDSEKMLFI